MVAGHDWGGSIAWELAMNHPEAVNRLAILNAAHPRKLSQGLHHPGQLRKSWYFFFFDLPDLPETIVHANHWHFFRHFLRDAHPAYTPEEMDRYIEAWSQEGASTGMINYYRSSVRTPPKRAAASDPPVKAPTLVIWGGTAITTSAPNWPNPSTRTCPTSTTSSGCPTPRTGSTTTSMSASTSCSLISSVPPAQPGSDQELPPARGAGRRAPGPSPRLPRCHWPWPAPRSPSARVPRPAAPTAQESLEDGAAGLLPDYRRRLDPQEERAKYTSAILDSITGNWPR